MPQRVIRGYAIAIASILTWLITLATVSNIQLQGQILLALVLGTPLLIAIAMSIGSRMPFGLIMSIAFGVPPLMIFFSAQEPLYYFTMLMIMPAMTHLGLNTFVPDKR